MSPTERISSPIAADGGFGPMEYDEDDDEEENDDDDDEDDEDGNNQEEPKKIVMDSGNAGEDGSDDEESGFGDDFDDFEEGAETADFGDFNDSYPDPAAVEEDEEQLDSDQPIPSLESPFVSSNYIPDVISSSSTVSSLRKREVHQANHPVTILASTRLLISQIPRFDYRSNGSAPIHYLPRHQIPPTATSTTPAHLQLHLSYGPIPISLVPTGGPAAPPTTQLGPLSHPPFISRLPRRTRRFGRDPPGFQAEETHPPLPLHRAVGAGTAQGLRRAVETARGQRVHFLCRFELRAIIAHIGRSGRQIVVEETTRAPAPARIRPGCGAVAVRDE